VEPVDLLLEEYRTVRQESLESVARLQPILAYTLVAVGVAITVALDIASDDLTAAAVILMGGVPVLIVVALMMLALELHRALDTRRQLRALEPRINACVPSDQALLTWEDVRRGGRVKGFNPFVVCFGAAIVGMILIGPVLVGVEVDKYADEFSAFYLTGVIVNVLVAAAATVWFVSINKKFQELDADARDDGSAMQPSSTRPR
jgi:hypothetical protein